MQMSGQILSFPDGTPIAYPAVEFDYDSALAPLVSEEQMKNILDRLDRLRLLVEQGRIDSLVLVGKDPVTGYFLTETCLDAQDDRTELFGFVGVLENLKLEISEQAAMAPVISLTGDIIDPFFEAKQ